MPDDVITRRHFLQAGTLVGLSIGLAGCGPSITSARPSGASGAIAATADTTSAAPSPTSRTTAPSPGPSETSSAAPTPAQSPSSSDPATLARSIAGLMIVGFRGATLGESPWLGRALRDGGLGGVILFDRDQLTGKDRNIRSPRQVRSLTAELRAAAGLRPIFVGVDQEGGRITRLGPAHGFPAVASEATIGAGSTARARTWAAALAGTLASAGIDLDFAPVVDLDIDPTSPAIGRLDRSFSKDPDVVVRMATIEIEAQRAADVRTVIKHFPGLGSATVNTDFGVADVTHTWARVELEPFRRLIAARSVDLIMSDHVVNGQLDPDYPASLSVATISGLLRGELGWDGPVVTDDLQAAAIDARYGADEATLLAIEAGNDLLLFANQQRYDDRIVERTVATISAAVAAGRIDPGRIDEATSRVAGLKPAG